MRILFCNLDPHWEFSTLVHHHCLDVYTDPGIEFWQVGAAGREKPDSWGDWPRRIAPEHLRAELMEAGQLLGDQEPLLLLVSATAPDPALDQELMALVREPWWRHCTAVLTVPAEDPPPPAPAGEPEPIVPPVAPDQAKLWRYTIRLDADPRQRLYGLRWLGEQLPDLRSLPQRIHFDGHPSDCVIQHWPPYARMLLQAADTVQHPFLDDWRHQVEAVHRMAFKRLGANPDQLDSLERFLDERLDDQALQPDAAPGAGELTEPAQALLQWPVPWFYDPRLPKDLHQNLNDFTDTLDRTLTERYATLHQTQQPERTRQWRTEQRELRAALAHYHAWTLGISEETINQLKHDRAELGHYRAAIRRRVERLTAFLRHQVDVTVRRRAPVFGDSEYRYRRQWLEADATLHAARRNAMAAAGRLVSRTRFWAGLAVVTGLALLPVLILRLPGLTRTGGVGSYLNNPAWWGPDSVWVAVFALIYLGFALHQVFRRRRRLRIALKDLRGAAENLWQQHFAILGNLFRYQDHTQAQRLLTTLDEQGERLLAELTRTQNYLNDLRRDLHRQLDYYLTLPTPPPETGVLGEGFDGQDIKALTPLQWLRLCLEREDWRRLPAQDIIVNGVAGPRKSRYLRHHLDR